MAAAAPYGADMERITSQQLKAWLDDASRARPVLVVLFYELGDKDWRSGCR